MQPEFFENIVLAARGDDALRARPARRRVVLFRQPPLAQAQAPRQRARTHFDIVVLRAGEMVQREIKLLQRHHAQVRLHPILEPHARLRFAVGRHLRDARLGREPVHHRPPGFPPPPENPNRRPSPARGANCPRATARSTPLTFARPARIGSAAMPGVPPQMPAAVGFLILDARDDILLRLRAKPRQRRDLARRAGLCQLRQRIHAELLVQRHDFFRPQPRHVEHFHQARLHARLQFVVVGQLPGLKQRGDFFHQRLAQARHVAQRARRDARAQVILQRAQRARAIVVGAYLERVFPGQFEQRPDFLEHGHNLRFIHGHFRSTLGARGSVPAVL